MHSSTFPCDFTVSSHCGWIASSHDICPSHSRWLCYLICLAQWDARGTVRRLKYSCATWPLVLLGSAVREHSLVTAGPRRMCRATDRSEPNPELRAKPADLRPAHPRVTQISVCYCRSLSPGKGYDGTFLLFNTLIIAMRLAHA